MLFKFRPFVNTGTKTLLFGIATVLILLLCAIFSKAVVAGSLLMIANAAVPAVPDVEAMQKAVMEKIEKRVTELANKAAEGKITKDDLDKELAKVNSTIKTLTDENIKKIATDLQEILQKNQDLTESVVKLSAEVKSLKDSGTIEKKKDVAPLTFREALKDAFFAANAGNNKFMEEVQDVNGKRWSMAKFFEGGGKKAMTPSITVKAPVDMFLSNIVGNYVQYLRLTETDPTRVSIPLTIYPHVMNVFMVKPISKPHMALLVVGSYEDGAALKAEGAAAGQSSFLLTTVSFPAKFIATYFNLSDETLDDLEEVMEEIAVVAPDKLMDEIDSIILGTAGDDIATIKGIRTAAKSTAYARQMAANSIPGAYFADVVADAKLQCEKNKHRPNVLYMNPTDFTELTAQKNAFNDSKQDKRVSYGTNGEPTVVCGLVIVKSTEIPVNNILVLDNRQPWIGRRRDLTLEIGYNGTDFVEGQRTVILKVRIAFGVRDAKGVIWVSDVTAAQQGLIAA